MRAVTDDEIRNFLRPRNDWTKILAFLVGVSGAIWGVVKWAAQSPTPEKVESMGNDLASVKQDMAITKVRIEGLQDQTSEIKAQQQRMETKLDEQLRRHGR